MAERMLHLLPLPPGKLRDSLDGRRSAAARWERWAAAKRSREPLVWLHAASVGEALAAEPIVRRLKALATRPTVIHTYTSPSVSQWPGPLSSDASGYAPGEWRGALRRTFAALRPGLLVFARGDVWPGLVAEAGQRGVPVAVAGATTRPAPPMISSAGRRALRGTHRRISWVGACCDEDAVGWARLGVPEARISVTGDPRDDYILERTPHLNWATAIADWAAGRPLLVAGSTHPPDEEVLLAALAGLPADCRLVIAPHEPSAEGAARLDGLAQRKGLTVAPWKGGTPEGDANVLLVQRVGVLADLYAAGSIAYVGGGFGRGGLHSVAEPAAYAMPIIGGPFAGAGRDGARFVASGGLNPISGRDSVSDLRRVWSGFNRNPGARWTAGLRARAVLAAGAAARTVTALEGLLERTGDEAAQRSWSTITPS